MAASKTGTGLLPRSQMPLKTLMIAMTIMCYLASLSIGALVLINQAVDKWSSDIAGEITIQIRQLDGKDIEERVSKAKTLLDQVKGVTKVEVLDKTAGAKLLEPWLGKSNIISELPIPRLLAVTINRASPPDFGLLEKQLQQAVKGASLDTHRRWQAELTRMGTSLKWLGYSVLMLIVLSAIALVIYASRSALEANRHTVEVLHFVGATDPYIARQVQWQFLLAGLKSGIAGMAMGVLTFLILGLSTATAASSGFVEASYSLLLGAPEVNYISYMLFFLIPLVATLICLIAARLAIMRILQNAI